MQEMNSTDFICIHRVIIVAETHASELMFNNPENVSIIQIPMYGLAVRFLSRRLAKITFEPNPEPPKQAWRVKTHLHQGSRTLICRDHPSRVASHSPFYLKQFVFSVTQSRRRGFYSTHCQSTFCLATPRWPPTLLEKWCTVVFN